MAIVSLYEEVHKSLMNNPNGHLLAERFVNEVRFDANKPFAAQLHEINVYWMVSCSRTNVDSLDVRLCLEEMRGREGKDVHWFLREWLDNFRKIVVPFLVQHVS